MQLAAHTRSAAAVASAPLCSARVLAAEEPKTFTYDNVYDDDSLQKDVYNETAFPLIQSVIEGYNGERSNTANTRNSAPSARHLHATHSLSFSCAAAFFRHGADNTQHK